MEIKKNPKMEFKDKKTLFFLSGLLISQCFVLYAFSFTQYEMRKNQTAWEDCESEYIEIEPTFHEEPKTIQNPIIRIDPEATEIEINPVEEIDTIVINPNPSISIIAPPPPPVYIDKEDKIEEFVEIMPRFPGGDEKMREFISKHFNYPRLAKTYGVEGRVLISFVIDQDGNVSDIKPYLPDNKQLGYGLEEEVIRVISKMPKWSPGQQRNKKVKVRLTIPVLCRLE